MVGELCPKRTPFQKFKRPPFSLNSQAAARLDETIVELNKNELSPLYIQSVADSATLSAIPSLLIWMPGLVAWLICSCVGEYVSYYPNRRWNQNVAIA